MIGSTIGPADVRDVATHSTRIPAERRPHTIVARDQTDRWLAVLRIAVGLWFLKSILTKLEPGLLAGWFPALVPTERWLGFLPGRLAEYAAGNPLELYAEFLDRFAVPNAAAFAHLTAWGEGAVGIGLTLGLCTRVAAGIGILLMLNYFLASFWMGPSQQGFHLILLVCMVVFLGAGAGRRWGVDGLFPRKRELS